MKIDNDEKRRYKVKKKVQKVDTCQKTKRQVIGNVLSLTCMKLCLGTQIVSFYYLVNYY